MQLKYKSSMLGALTIRWRVIKLEERLQNSERKLALAASYDSAKHTRIQQLEAELVEWREMRDPDVLTQLLLQGVPSRLTQQQIERLLVDRQLEVERSICN